jgi:hypothetical protein
MMLLQQLSSPKPGLSVAFRRCDLIQTDLTFSRSIPICFNRTRRILHDGDRAGFVRDSFFRDRFFRDVLSGTEPVLAIGRLRSVVHLTLGRSCDSSEASPWTIVVDIRARSRLSEGKLINA